MDVEISKNKSHQQTFQGFQKRYYARLKSFWTDLSYMFSHKNQIKSAMRSPLVSPAFRERLMLAVTEVNGCRYCRTFHVGQAKQVGISSEEIAVYLKGTIPDEVPEEEKLAVCYARHWAETDADPYLGFIDQVREIYGEDGFQAIGMVLRMIRMGNLLGNTADYILYRLSFGWLGQ
ncbi:MAG: carboxymuconolactone decarboxylase family protein [Chloroflexi bacterium]|nr:carboxymuconolactone decarboxylase family protein [Chloroflexota bacterium]